MPACWLQIKSFFCRVDLEVNFPKTALQPALAYQLNYSMGVTSPDPRDSLKPPLPSPVFLAIGAKLIFSTDGSPAAYRPTP
jgi:hypothetical protein